MLIHPPGSLLDPSCSSSPPSFAAREYQFLFFFSSCHSPAINHSSSCAYLRSWNLCLHFNSQNHNQTTRGFPLPFNSQQLTASAHPNHLHHIFN
jgi:hypothetical protein